MFEKLEKASKLHKSFHYEESIALCKEVLQQDKHNIPAYSIIAGCYLDSGDYEKAVALLTQLVKKNPNDIISITNLSAAMRENCHIEESEKLALMAYERDPNNQYTLQNLGQLYVVTNRHKEAKKVYINLCSLYPKNVLGHLALGGILMLEGEIDAGLRELEIGNQLADLESAINDEPAVPGLYWNGMTMDDKLLVLLDQGFGDALQHASRIKNAAEKCKGGIIVCGDPAILPLFKHIDGVSDLVENGGLAPGYGAYCRISSLPVLGCEAEKPPYLKNVTPSYTKGDRPLVGLSWKTRPIPRARSVPLQFLAAELSDLDVDFISLHHETTQYELNVFPMKTTKIDNVGDVAGIVASCDLVITVDSLMCHIAGAMDKKGLLLLAAHWDYKWGTDETECHLYPSLDMARQEKMGDWTIPVISSRDHVENYLESLK